MILHNVYFFGLNKRMDGEVFEKVIWEYPDKKRRYSFCVIVPGALTVNGKKVVQYQNVNQSQWEQCDVPYRIVQCQYKKHRDVNSNRRNKFATDQIRARSLQRPRELNTPYKNQRKIYNEEIERWLAEHNGIDFSEFEDNSIISDEPK